VVDNFDAKGDFVVGQHGDSMRDRMKGSVRMKRQRLWKARMGQAAPAERV
jgi:hypothetical protein